MGTGVRTGAEREGAAEKDGAVQAPPTAETGAERTEGTAWTPERRLTWAAEAWPRGRTSQAMMSLRGMSPMRL